MSCIDRSSTGWTVDLRDQQITDLPRRDDTATLCLGVNRSGVRISRARPINTGGAHTAASSRLVSNLSSPSLRPLRFLAEPSGGKPGSSVLGRGRGVKRSGVRTAPAAAGQHPSAECGCQKRPKRRPDSRIDSQRTPILCDVDLFKPSVFGAGSRLEPPPYSSRTHGMEEVRSSILLSSTPVNPA
jgi:hypothetical protein